jgi:Ca2+-transporting ATPase
LALVVYVPPLANLFRFAPLGPLDVALCVGAGMLSVAWFEMLKWIEGVRRSLSREDSSHPGRRRRARS